MEGGFPAEGIRMIRELGFGEIESSNSSRNNVRVCVCVSSRLFSFFQLSGLPVPPVLTKAVL